MQLFIPSVCVGPCQCLGNKSLGSGVPGLEPRRRANVALNVPKPKAYLLFILFYSCLFPILLPLLSFFTLTFTSSFLTPFSFFFFSLPHPSPITHADRINEKKHYCFKDIIRIKRDIQITNPTYKTTKSMASFMHVDSVTKNTIYSLNFA